MFCYTQTHTPRYTNYNYESKTLDIATCTLPTKNGFHRTPNFGKYGGNISLKGGCPKMPDILQPFLSVLVGCLMIVRKLYNLKACLIIAAQHSTENPSIYATYLIYIHTPRELGPICQACISSRLFNPCRRVFMDYTPTKIHGTGSLFYLRNAWWNSEFSHGINY